MALKAMMLKKSISDYRSALDALEAKVADFQLREAEIEASINEAANEEERDAVNAAIDTFEADKAANEAEKVSLRDKIAALEAQLAEIEAAQEPAPCEVIEERKDIPEMEIRDNETAVQERSAFANYVRGVQTRDDYNMTQGNNGAIVPKTIADEITVKVKEVCPIFEKATKFNIKGTLEVPYYPYSSDHVIAAAYANEMSALTASSGDMGSVEMTGYAAGALAKISRKLITNTSVDVVPFIEDQMVEAFRQFYEHEALVGTTNKATGLLAGIESSATVTAAAMSTITADELIACQMKVPTAFQSNCCWIMAPATFELVRKLKDGDSRYLLNPDMREGFGFTLLGKPVYLSENMPALGTSGNKAVVYGDLSGLGIKLAENLEIQVLNERYADVHAVGVIGWTEIDAKVINGQKFGCIKCGASDPQ